MIAAFVDRYIECRTGVEWTVNSILPAGAVIIVELPEQRHVRRFCRSTALSVALGAR
ncbi:MAG: hypothetical protein AVDCRST_MAG93-2536 [uncultured Chloroflexia bacterium]|uniref:Uncharacterized protein n=1 Tax=uncultured Chloroflexia bacterium TaxID=1672391 RepID=A0A6J4J4P1_9CHLR|nr:MAG: hypothetical protein AVDCRST_MAG93-2536 [uncultured Chloroflexia bacterium]